FPGWVNADDYAPKRRLRESTFRPNWTLDITRAWRCPDDYWDGIFTEHVIEHLSYSEAANVLRECFRTLKPGAWLRVSVPDIRRFVLHDGSHPISPGAPALPFQALAISFATQMHFHRSTWDAELLVRVLSDVGFSNVRPVAYQAGTDSRLIKDDHDKANESVYVEAQK
ncbi:MAG TPA: methyltransferase domain-containing protein, partial [Steroidobacteraceae bacterium]|nr:methyltransferase domain-containing protein [Steroidobacteraceae bacterium]